MEQGGKLMWQKLPPVLSVVVISAALIVLIMSWTAIPSPADKRPVSHAQNSAISSENSPVKNGDSVETHSNQEKITIAAHSLEPATVHDSKQSDSALTVTASSETKDRRDDTETQSNGENVVIKAHSLEPNIPMPGTLLTIKYTIDAARDMTVRLGCSIQKMGTTRWMSDPDNDKIVSVSPGKSEYSREFLLPSTLNSGKYHLSLALWDQALNTVYDYKSFSNDLTIAVFSSDEARSDISRFFSIQVAAFKNRENAEELYSELLSKQYPVRIEYSGSVRKNWHLVLIGKFFSKQDAILFAKQFRKREGISYIIISCRSTEKNKVLSTAALNR